jgi:pimeloyl-ACP methyl ester carboxylesterase
MRPSGRSARRSSDLAFGHAVAPLKGRPSSHCRRRALRKQIYHPMIYKIDHDGAKAAAADLHQLLERLHIDQPVVLVGHSLGGLYAQYFARHYPPHVGAVVLIDATSPFEPVADPRFQTRAKLKPGSTDYWENAGVDTSILQTRQSPPFPPIPLLVLTATDHRSPQTFEQEWRHIQARTAAQWPLGRQVIAQGSGHYIQNDQPELVIDQIRQLVLQLRHGQ